MVLSADCEYNDGQIHGTRFLSKKAMSIKSRLQSARTYLERVLTELEGSDRSTLIKHGLISLRETLPADPVCYITLLISIEIVFFTRKNSNRTYKVKK